MLLDLRKLSGEFERVERRYAPETIPGGDDYAVRTPVVLVFDVRKDRDRYHLTGTVETTLELVCGRCLEAYALPVRSAFDLRYLPQSANTGEGEREVEEDDLTTAYYRDERIELGDLVREQLYLALPMKPLCREDCRGLCAECGANLNLTRCGCARRWEDPRLAGLRALLDERKD